MKSFLLGIVAAILVASAPLMAAAQTQTRVEAMKDWSIFVSGEGAQKVCWVASQPTSSSAVRGGQSVEVRRGDIFLMVAFRPGDGARNEVSFLAGYPFKKGSSVEASVGSEKFEMFTMGENAWMSSADRDKAIIDAFKRGSRAQVKGVSGRGTTTTDTFSLSGFTAALTEAEKRCQ